MAVVAEAFRPKPEKKRGAAKDISRLLLIRRQNRAAPTQTIHKVLGGNPQDCACTPTPAKIISSGFKPAERLAALKQREAALLAAPESATRRMKEQARIQHQRQMLQDLINDNALCDRADRYRLLDDDGALRSASCVRVKRRPLPRRSTS